MTPERDALSLAKEMMDGTCMLCTKSKTCNRCLLSSALIDTSARLERARVAIEKVAPEDGIYMEHRNERDTCAWCGSSSLWCHQTKTYVDHHSEDCAWAGARRALADTGPAVHPSVSRDDRQKRVFDWCVAAFGEAHTNSIPQRGIRLAEEEIEAAQAAGCDTAMVHKLVDHIYAKPAGTLNQEIGGVGITLLALAQAAGLSADDEEACELTRVLAKPLAHFAARNKAKNDAGFNLEGVGPAVEGPKEWRCVCRITLPRCGTKTSDGYLRCQECKRVWTLEGVLVYADDPASEDPKGNE